MSGVFGHMPVPITAVYAVLLTLVATVLAFQAGRHRGQAGISVYYASDMELATKMRRHATSWARRRRDAARDVARGGNSDLAGGVALIWCQFAVCHSM